MGFSGASLYLVRCATKIIQHIFQNLTQFVNTTLSYLSIIEYIKSEISILKIVAVLSQIIIEGASIII